MSFKKATKFQSKLRLALFGPSGSGKTYTALRIASGMGGKIAVIDTEHGSASKYSGKFNFDVCDLSKKTIESYAAAIRDAAAGQYDVLIIDSLSHAWLELLEEVNKLSETKYKGNSWGAWATGTPRQRDFIEAILDYPGHIIATMRVKTEWVIETNDKGRNCPKKIGLSPEQGKGIEYEFDILAEINDDHFCKITKDRTGKFQDKSIEKPGEEFGKELIEWLKDGVESLVVDDNYIIDSKQMDGGELLDALLDGCKLGDLGQAELSLFAGGLAKGSRLRSAVINYGTKKFSKVNGEGK
jgi:nucleoside-triphosphatase THEP1